MWFPYVIQNIIIDTSWILSIQTISWMTSTDFTPGIAAQNCRPEEGWRQGLCLCWGTSMMLVSVALLGHDESVMTIDTYILVVLVCSFFFFYTTRQNTTRLMLLSPSPREWMCWYHSKKQANLSCCLFLSFLRALVYRFIHSQSIGRIKYIRSIVRIMNYILSSMYVYVCMYTICAFCLVYDTS